MTMNAEKFEELVAKRANDRVQKRIKTFKRAVLQAIKDFDPDCPGTYGHLGQTPSNPFSSEVRAYLTHLASDDHTSGWPGNLWEREENKVREELFAIGDEMMKALASSGPSDDDDTPALPTPDPNVKAPEGELKRVIGDAETKRD